MLIRKLLNDFLFINPLQKRSGQSEWIQAAPNITKLYTGPV